MPTRVVDPFAIPPTGDQSSMASVVMPTLPGAVGPAQAVHDIAGAPSRRAWENVTDTLGPKTDPMDILMGGRAEVAQQIAQAAAVRTDGLRLRASWDPLTSDKAQPGVGDSADDGDDDGDDDGEADDGDESGETTSEDDQINQLLGGDTAKTAKEIGPDANFLEYVDILRPEIEPSIERAGNMLNGGLNAAAALPEDVEKDIVSYVQECFTLSHDRISRRYDYWREADQTHDLYVPTYVVEAMQASTKKGLRKKPRIVDVIRTPYSRAICDVRCTYNLAIFGGNPPFPIYPIRRNASKLGARIIQAELTANMRRVGFERTIYQITLDQNRYGMSPTAIYYGKYGNTPINIDPWNYFPDPRVTMQSQGDGDFIGVRSTASISALYRRGMYANLGRVEKTMITWTWPANMPINESQRGTKPGPDITGVRTDNASAETKFGLGRANILNTLYAFISPKWFGIDGPFGLYRITVANETVVIMFDRSPWPHKNFPVVNGACDWDAHKVFASSAYELGAPLQRFQDWLLRARVENTQNLIRGRMIVDPTRIMVDDILNPNTARLIRALPGADINTALKPIDQQDTTQNFWGEMNQAAELQQRLLSANDTAQGMQTETERSATEIARITSLGQQRLGSQARMLSSSQMRPMATQMISNLQYFGVEGGQIELPQELAATDNGWYEWQQKDILGEFDYLLSDGTLPGDPRANTDNLMRAIRIIGETNTAPDWNMSKLFTELFLSMGFTDVEDWRNNQKQATAQLGAQQANAAANNPGVAAQVAQTAASVVDDHKMRQDLAAGNVVPLSEAMRQTASRMSEAPAPPLNQQPGPGPGGTPAMPMYNGAGQ